MTPQLPAQPARGRDADGPGPAASPPRDAGREAAQVATGLDRTVPDALATRRGAPPRDAPEAHLSPPRAGWRDPNVDLFAENATVRFETSPDGDRHVAHIESEAGRGTMSGYSVFPGVTLILRDLRMAECVASSSRPGNYLNIVYCREGRLEHPSTQGENLFTARGDVKIDDMSDIAGRYVLPFERYLDITFSFDIDVCEDVISQTFGGFPVSVRDLRDRFCSGTSSYVLHGLPQIEQIFTGLETVDASIRTPYAQVKVLELLLLLSRTERAGSTRGVTYFRRALVQKVKEAREIMLADLGANYTIEEIARRVDVPVTTFKNCFKSVYGAPPHTYLRARRMEHAANLLATTQDTVISIGMAVGYDSPSKFSAAFRQVMGMTPTQFRRRTSV